jgi:Icc-related predicted phosphoesterase
MKRARSSNTGSRGLTIVCIADTHQLHRELDLPYGDILIHAGDFTMMSRSASAISDFDAWLGELPHPIKLVVPGNHDYFLEGVSAMGPCITNAIVLINQGIEVMGLRVWGSPTTPLYGGAFGMSLDMDRRKLYAAIPPDVDVLISHGPPHGILDVPPGTSSHGGCAELLEAVTQRRPKLHVFGHVHGAYGMLTGGDTLFVNAALLGLDGSLTNSPVVLRMSPGDGNER